jgi:mRNA interferase RelE/StbE
MDIQFTDHSLKQLKKIAKADKKTANRIVDRLKRYANAPQDSHDVKVLKGGSGDITRLRVGDYRILFTIEGSSMVIAVIKHRQGAYHD